MIRVRGTPERVAVDDLTELFARSNARRVDYVLLIRIQERVDVE